MFEMKDEDMRMLDPEIFQQEWFDELPPRLKLLYIYIMLKCDCGGIIEINLKRWSYDTGYEAERFTRKDIFCSFGNRVRPVNGDIETATKAIVPDFIRFHYGARLINDRRHVLHRAAVKRIKAAGLTVEQVCEMANKKFEYDDFSDVVNTLQQNEFNINAITSKTKAEESKPQKNTFVKPTLDEVKEYFKEKGTDIDPEEFFAKYDSVGWVDKNGNRIKNWKRCLVTWEKFRIRNQGGSPSASAKKPSSFIQKSTKQAKEVSRVLG